MKQDLTDLITRMRQARDSYEAELAGTESFRALQQLDSRSASGEPMEAVQPDALRRRILAELDNNTDFAAYRRLDEAIAVLEGREIARPEPVPETEPETEPEATVGTEAAPRDEGGSGASATAGAAAGAAVVVATLAQADDGAGEDGREGEILDPVTREAEVPDAEVPDAEASDAETSDAETSDAGALEAKSPDAETEAAAVSALSATEGAPIDDVQPPAEPNVEFSQPDETFTADHRPPSEQAPRPADDLGLIREIDRHALEALEGQGIRTFDQIAGLSAEDVARLAQVPGVGRRISSEAWIEQAAILASGGTTLHALRLGVMRGQPNLTISPAAMASHGPGIDDRPGAGDDGGNAVVETVADADADAPAEGAVAGEAGMQDIARGAAAAAGVITHAGVEIGGDTGSETRAETVTEAGVEAEVEPEHELEAAEATDEARDPAFGVAAAGFAGAGLAALHAVRHEADDTAASTMANDEPDGARDDGAGAITEDLETDAAPTEASVEEGVSDREEEQQTLSADASDTIPAPDEMLASYMPTEAGQADIVDAANALPDTDDGAFAPPAEPSRGTDDAQDAAAASYDDVAFAEAVRAEPETREPAEVDTGTAPDPRAVFAASAADTENSGEEVGGEAARAGVEQASASDGDAIESQYREAVRGADTRHYDLARPIDALASEDPQESEAAAAEDGPAALATGPTFRELSATLASEAAVSSSAVEQEQDQVMTPEPTGEVEIPDTAEGVVDEAPESAALHANTPEQGIATEPDTEHGHAVSAASEEVGPDSAPVSSLSDPVAGSHTESAEASEASVEIVHRSRTTDDGTSAEATDAPSQDDASNTGPRRKRDGLVQRFMTALRGED